MDNQLIFVILLAIAVIIIKLSIKMENFNDCYQYGNDYNKCYNNNCTIMLDTNGNAFCTNK